ncbi:MAG: DUF1127 domain-containing protein [Pseudomonadota bacterium]
MSLIAKILQRLTSRADESRRLLSMNDRDLADIGLTRGELGRILRGGVNREACCSI